MVLPAGLTVGLHSPPRPASPGLAGPGPVVAAAGRRTKAKTAPIAEQRSCSAAAGRGRRGAGGRRPPPLDVEGYLACVQRCRDRFPGLRILTGAELGEPRLRQRQADTERLFRLIGRRPIALAFAVVFGLLALVSSVTVGEHISTVPLFFLLAVAGLVTLYVLIYVPRLERHDAKDLAARHSARAAARRPDTRGGNHDPEASR
jgi:hypothetical protein